MLITLISKINYSCKWSVRSVQWAHWFSLFKLLSFRLKEGVTWQSSGLEHIETGHWSSRKTQMCVGRAWVGNAKRGGHLILNHLFSVCPIMSYQNSSHTPATSAINKCDVWLHQSGSSRCKFQYLISGHISKTRLTMFHPYR